MPEPGICSVLVNCAGNVLSNLFDLIFTLISNPINLVRKCNKNVDNLKQQVDKLKLKEKTVEDNVHAVRRRGEEISQELEKWLITANNLTEAADKLVADADENAKKKCFFGLCLNPKSRYQLSKKAENDSKAIDKLVDETHGFNLTLYHIPAPQQEVAAPVKGFENFDSRSDVLEKIMEALQITSINVVGVHGMPGVGKTMLVKEVKRRAEQDKLFDAVAMAYVTKDADLKRIQNEIAPGLRLDQLPNNAITTQDAADRIKARLKRMKKVLIILDDIWGTGIELEELGICLKNAKMTNVGSASKEEYTECKILLASRGADVLSDMGAQEVFQVIHLQSDESWTLFNKIVGEQATSCHEMHDIATGIVQECEGLPIAITTIAQGLKNKPTSVWRNALAKLKTPSSENFNGICENIYHAVEISYSHLRSDKLKRTFLLCSLMGKNALIEDLLKYGVGLGLFTNTIEEARDEALALMEELKGSSLIEGYDNRHCYMHGVIHGVAISIACKDRHGLLVTDDCVPREWEDKKAMAHFEWIFLRYLNAGGPADGPSYGPANELQSPQLLFCLGGEDYSLEILANFLNQMHGLQVLYLTKMRFTSLPSSIGLLKNLRTLCLDQSMFEDIRIIGNLMNLKILSLLNSDLEELPREIGRLTRLKLLDLRNCTKLKVILPSLLARMSTLEELYLGNSFNQWEDEGHQNHASLSELNNLNKLTALEICIRDVQIIPEDLFSKKLKRYKIFIGDVWNNNWDSSFETSRIVKLQLKEASSFGCSVVKRLLEMAEELHLQDLNGVKNVVNESNNESFKDVKYLFVRNASEVQQIINSSVEGVLLNAFPNLEVLFFHNLINLENIFQGQFKETAFNKLTVITIESCDQVQNFFSPSIARQLLQLQEINVKNCSNLEGIVDDDDQQGSGNDIVEDKPKFGELLRSLTLKHLPRLVSFNSRRHMPLFNEQVGFLKLEELQLSWINVITIWHISITSSCVGKLTKLIIEGCDNLEYLFSFSMAKGLVMLRHLEIRECNRMREVIYTENIDEMENLRFPQLNFLMIKDLQNIISFCSGNYVIDVTSMKQCQILNCPNMEALRRDAAAETQMLFDEQVNSPNLECLRLSSLNIQQIWHNPLPESSVQNLKRLFVEDCGNLKYLITSSIVKRFSQLIQLEIRDCKMMEEVILTKNLVEEERMCKIFFPRLDSIILQDLPKLTKFSSGSYLQLPSLWQLMISNCPMLKTFISNSIFEDMAATSETAENSCTPLFNSKVAFPKLERLAIFMTGSNKIWHEQLNADSFCQLTTVSVASCEKLMNIFPFSMLGMLQRLDKLEIWNCESLEEIFESQGLSVSQSLSQTTTQSTSMEYSKRFVLLKLTHVDLHGLPKLKSFLPQMHITEWPSLKKLWVHGCDQVQIFASQFSSIQITKGDDQHGIQITYPLFWISKATFPCLEELKLESNNSMKEIWHGQYLGDYFPKLKVLELIQFPKQSVVQPLFFQSLSKLEKLVVSEAPFHEIFQCQGLAGEENTALAFAQLSELRLSKLHELTCLWKDESHLESVFCNLKTLEVQKCSKLKNLVPSFITFKNLMTLKVSRCHELINLVGYSTAKSMVQLIRMSISECRMIKEIVACLDDEVRDGIVFSQLKYLELCGLPRLASFCSGNCSFEFTSLEEAIVMTCPNMQLFSQGECRTPNKLQKVKFIKDEDEGFWEGNLNSTIQKIFTEKVGYLDLKLSEFPESEFPELIESWYKKPQEKLPFKRLKSLEVCNCNNMRYLLTTSMALGLVQLHDLKVTNCAMMEQVITGEGSEEMFPLLNSIILESCSNLICFYEGRKRLKFGSLKQITIADCPILVAFATSFSREQGKEITADDKGSEERLNIPTQPFFSDKVAFPNLEELQLFGISVNNIWPTSITSSYVEKLTKLIINGCDNLKYLFSYSMARDLEMLGHLEIHKCKKMREVLFTENVEENGNLIFPQLRFLLIQSLPKLRGFCYGIYIKFPCLSQLSIKCCPVLKTFISGSTFGYMTTTSNKAKNICTPLFDAKVTFTKLEQLILEDMGSLDQIWDNQLDADSFCQLNQLRVENCGKLLNIFPFSMLEKLQSLDNLKIWNCDSLEEIFESQGVGVSQSQAQNITRSVEPATKFVFSTLTCVELRTLPKLKAFCHQKHAIECPSLKELKVFRCDQVQTFASEFLSFPRTKGDKNELEIQTKYPLFWISKATFPSLEELELHRNGIMKEIWHGKYSGGYFPKLTRMTINECDMLKEIVACVDDKVKDGIIVFSQLKYLELRGLPRLESFCSRNCSFEFASLEEVIVMGCPNMQIFSQGECSTPNKLQKVKLIVGEDEGLWEGNLNSTIQRMFTGKAGYLGLENLDLSIFPELIEIWNKKPYEILPFKNLKYLKICECNNLRYLLTTSMMLGLVQLFYLRVANCAGMEQVISGEGAEDTFPKLCLIILKSCPNLKCFYDGCSRPGFPELHTITVVDCPVLATFTSSFLSEQEKKTTTNDREGEESSFDIPTQPFLSDKASFPSLKNLKLEGNNIMKEVWRGDHPRDYCPNLQNVELINFPEQSAVLPPFFFQSLPYLSKLVVSNASFDEIFQCEGVGADENPANTLPWLRQKPAKAKGGYKPPWLKEKPANALTWFMELKLSKLHELKYLWKEELHLELVFYNLRILEVQECSKLKNLVPSFISFENLTTLDVSKCHGLIHVLGNSTAKSVVHLKRMSISECDMIYEIVALGDEEMKDGICFNNLEYLELCCLPKLASFCSRNCGFDFPSLEEVIVMDCPNMQVFSSRQLSTPKLQEVELNEDGNECCWYGDLNSTIQHLFMEKGSYDSEKDITGGYENRE